MRRPSVNWSDLAAAGALSRELVRREPAPGPAGDESGFSRFRPPKQAAPPPASAPTPGQPVELLEISTFEAFLAWSLDLTRARAGFVVDSEGFTLASRGDPPAEGFEGIGAQLCHAMDQLEKIDPQSGMLRLLELQLDRGRLIGVRADAGDLGKILIGLEGSFSLADDVRDRLIRQFTHSLPGLR